MATTENQPATTINVPRSGLPSFPPFDPHGDHATLRPVSNVKFCMHRIQFTLDSTAIVKFDVCFKRRI